MPVHPLQRFCSAECRAKNRQWCCWRAQHSYRRTTNGRNQRREQSRRYRIQRKERPAPDRNAGATTVAVAILPEILADSQAISRPATPADDAVAADVAKVDCQSQCPPPDSDETVTATPPEHPREGHQYRSNSMNSCCSRPGCYERFIATTRSPRQSFCSSVCHKALRRVKVREAWWLQRYGIEIRGYCGKKSAPD